MNGYLQQLYGLQRCWELVQEFASQHHVSYDTLIRLRTDHVLSGSDYQPVEATNMSIHIPVGDDYNGYNDRIAWGPTTLMHDYMSRFTRMQMLTANEYNATNFHAESFLYSTLVQANIPVSRVNVTYVELPKEGC